ncbi:MAG: type III-B CRISPR module-associated protein Cmr5 [Gemmataceae bacterium]|jgi:CRISPR-associated protein Cmr5|nr:type III-B CRISPR module-associated protein Cmr5 [Gemmataceae bacterium]
MSEPKKDQATPDQKRAKHAYDVVRNLKDGTEFDEFYGASQKLPVRIMASGLGQALAFIRAKNKTPALVKALGDWVLRDLPEKDRDLLNAIITGDADKLREYTSEAMAYLQWVNRFCEAREKISKKKGS